MDKAPHWGVMHRNQHSASLRLDSHQLLDRLLLEEQRVRVLLGHWLSSNNNNNNHRQQTRSASLLNLLLPLLPRIPSEPLLNQLHLHLAR